MKDFESRVLAFIEERKLVQPGQKVVVALSGGGDSVGLLAVLHALRERLGIELIAAHADHGLRESSTMDAEAARAAAQELGIAFEEARLGIRRQPGRSLEELAREKRYRFLEDMAAKWGASKIAIGHTMEDRAETFLLNLARGSGASGLSSLRSERDELFIRPLLKESRTAVRNYAEAKGLKFCNDPSNQDPRFARNRVRHELIPLMDEVFGPGVAWRIARAADLLEEDDRLLEDLARKECRFVVEKVGSEVWLDQVGLLALSGPIAARVVLKALESVKGDRLGVTLEHVKSILNLSNRHGTPGIGLPGGLRCERWREKLVLRKEEVGDGQRNEFSKRIVGPGRMKLDHGFVVDVSVRQAERNNRDQVFVGKRDSILSDLEFRYWRPGDRIELPGIQGSKKLSDLYIDLKVPRWRRDQVPLLADKVESGKVYWVVGLRYGNGPWAEAGSQSLGLRLSARPKWLLRVLKYT